MRIIVAVMCAAAVWMFFYGTCMAEDMEKAVADSYLEELDLEEIQDTIDQLFPEAEMNFRDSILELMEGKSPVSPETMKQLMYKLVLGELKSQRAIMIRILVLAVVSAVFANFVKIFDGSQISDIAFYMIYLLLFVILMKAFEELDQMASDHIGQVLHFMKLLLPVYLVTASLAAGSVTAAGFYELTLFFITGAQLIINYIVLPGIKFYVLFLLLNHLGKEDYLSRLSALIELALSWILKTLLAVLVGVQTVQALLLPAIDSLKNGVLNKAAGAVPVLGNTLNAVTETVLGTAVLLKNAVGAAGMIIIVMICMAPAVRLAVCTLLYKAVSAAVQPVSDKRITECIAGVGEGTALLLKTVGTMGIMLLLTLAIVTASIKGL
ncbi:MAG: stage III sporulation protein AE [Eubacteriales bacterium]|nr:stage III sporulation protein AE [Eubacteriales bacterium]